MDKLHESVLNRASVRQFSDKEIPAELKQKLYDAIFYAPTSSNWFSSSAIIVTDKELLERIGNSNRFAKAVKTAKMFVVFVADFNRMNLAKKQFPDVEYNSHSSEGFLVAAGDCFIQATMLQDMAISNGLGTCFLGLVRTMVPELIKELNIEGQAYPVIGLAIGYPDEEIHTKPKLNRIFENRYDINLLDKEATQYSTKLENHFMKLAPDKKAYSYYEAMIRSASNYRMNTDLIEQIWELELKNK
ncbi:nitroreductase family protein [[Mycoplasma] gypis]|uniref:Nitroreductase family protein n=1 Tax=[Mycoplasma] gypis TaxID=92404 RepID=A0ABZ2RNU6_9BACT|nr:nitroreductase family protein [[Mycoplasma] gypis]MBN0919298.1 nitroreductase family protein [[Mycoplasma] gypis]